MVLYFEESLCQFCSATCRMGERVLFVVTGLIVTFVALSGLIRLNTTSSLLCRFLPSCVYGVSLKRDEYQQF